MKTIRRLVRSALLAVISATFIPSAFGAGKLQSFAYDAAGNAGQSTVITVIR